MRSMKEKCHDDDGDDDYDDGDDDEDDDENNDTGKASQRKSDSWSDKQARSTCNQIFHESLFLSCQQASSNCSSCLVDGALGITGLFCSGFVLVTFILKNCQRHLEKDYMSSPGAAEPTVMKNAEAWLRPLLAYLCLTLLCAPRAAFRNEISISLKELE